MKKIFKSPLFTFILGAIIFSGVTGVVAYTINANEVEYTPKDTTWQVSDVKDALDDLYTTADEKISELNTQISNKDITITSLSSRISNLELELNTYKSKYDKVIFTLMTDTYSNKLSDGEISLSNYKYFKVYNKTLDSNVAECYPAVWSNAQNKEIEINENQQYNIKDNDDGYNISFLLLKSRSNNNGVWSRCSISVELYN